MESQKRKRLFAGIVAIAIIAFVCWFFLLRNTEPTYDGKRLSEWVTLYWDRSGEEAEVAIRSIGTNALPYLLDWVAWEPSKGRLCLEELDRQGPRFLQPNPLVNHLLYGRNRYIAGSGYAFSALGTAAAPAVPQLAALVKPQGLSEEADEVNKRALTALGAIGLPAMPALTNLMGTVYKDELLYKTYIDSALLAQGTNAMMAIPALLDRIQHDDPQFVADSIATLKRLGLDADRVVPALTNLLRNPDTNIQRHAVEAIAAFTGKSPE